MYVFCKRSTENPHGSISSHYSPNSSVSFVVDSYSFCYSNMYVYAKENLFHNTQNIETETTNILLFLLYMHFHLLIVITIRLFNIFTKKLQFIFHLQFVFIFKSIYFLFYTLHFVIILHFMLHFRNDMLLYSLFDEDSISFPILKWSFRFLFRILSSF